MNVARDSWNLIAIEVIPCTVVEVDLLDHVDRNRITCGHCVQQLCHCP